LERQHYGKCRSTGAQRYDLVNESGICSRGPETDEWLYQPVPNTQMQLNKKTVGLFSCFARKNSKKWIFYEIELS
jgi:hypothetical protein